MEAMPRRARFTRLGPMSANNIFGPHRSMRYEVEALGIAGNGRVDDLELERLIAVLPGIRSVQNCGEPGPVGLAHLVEHLAIELQNLAGPHLECTRGAGAADDRPVAVVPFEEEAILERALRWIAATLELAEGFDPRVALREFIEYAARKSLPAQDRMLIASAQRRDVPVSRVAGRTFTLGQGQRQRRISGTKTSLTNIVSNDLAANKDYARRILQERGLPVPLSERVYSRRAALAAAERIGFPVVVKPIFGSMGHGVTVGVSNARELRAAYLRVREHGRAVLVEEFVAGDDYRLLVIGGKLCAAARRMPGHVVGDGRLTVRQLVEEANRDPRRGHDHNAPLTRLEIDDQARTLLAALGYGTDSVPAEGEMVFLRRNANLSTGGTAVDVTDIVHPETRRVAERAARAIGLDIAGVDLLTTDVTRSLYETGGKICEINSRPGIRKHIWPVEGRSRDVTGPIVDMLFPAGSNGRIPAVAVVGDRAADHTAQLLAHVLQAHGRRVGLGRDGRVYTDGIEHRRHERLVAPALIRSAILDPDVDVAVLQFEAAEAAAHGLGCDAFDVAVIVDCGPLPPAPSTIQGLGLVMATTRRAVLVDADLPPVAIPDGAPDGLGVTRVGAPGSPREDRVRAERLAFAAAGHLGIAEPDCRAALAGFTAIEAGAQSERTRSTARRNFGRNP